MKLDACADSETICSHSTLTSRPDSQIFHYDDSTVETVWKMKNEVMGEDKRRTVSDGDIEKLNNNTIDLLAHEKCGEIRKVPQLRDLLVEEKSVNDGKETEDPFKSSSVKLPEKDTKFYTDKKLSELELEELMVYFKEAEDRDYHVVKDICVDDGLPSHDKLLIENDKVENKGILSSMHTDMDANKVLSNESMETEPPILKETNPFVECHGKLDVSNNYCSETLTGFDVEDNDENIHVGNAESNIFSPTNPFLESDRYTNFATRFNSESSSENGDEILNENIDSEEPIVCGTNPFSKEDDGNKYCSESSVENTEEDVDKIVNPVSDEKATHETLVTMQKLDICITPEPSKSDKNEDQQQSDQVIRTDAHSADSMVPSVVEETSECNQEEGPLSSQMDSASITSDSGASVPETSGKEGDSKDTDCQHSVKSLTMPIIEEETLDGLTVSSRSFSSHDYGETSFSAAGPMSGRIAYSGPIPYSGSISIRSDSSTTSTRSFAFPVLHSEWNSSPVKMAKADRRSFRKQRGWLPSLLCCRF